MANPFNSFHQRFTLAVGLAASVVLAMGLVNFSRDTQDLTFAQGNLAETLDIMSKRYPLENPDIAMNPQGDIVIVWQEKKGRDYDIYALKTHRDRVYLEKPIRVNRYTVADQKEPRVSMDAKGNFAVVWTSFKQDGSGSGVFGQRFNTKGKPRGVEFRVNTTAKDSQEAPDIAMNASGHFAVVWTSESGFGKEKRIYLQLFDLARQKTQKEIKVDTAEGAVAVSMQNPGVALNDEGRGLVVWQAMGEKEDWNIKARGFDASGALAAPAEIKVNAVESGSHLNPAVSGFGPNQFLVTWEKNLKWEQYKDLELIYQNIQAALVNDQGAIAKAALEVEAPTFNDKQDPKAVRWEAGGVVVWQEKQKEGKEWVLKGQPLDAQGNKTEKTLELSQNTDQPFWNPQTSSDKLGKMGVVWKGKHPRNGKGIIRFRQLDLEVATETAFK